MEGKRMERHGVDMTCQKKIGRWMAMFCFVLMGMVCFELESFGMGTITGLKQTDATGTAATICWNRYSGAKYYDIYYATSSSGAYKKINESHQETTYHFSDLRQGRTYYVRIHAYNMNAQKIAQSATLTIVTAPVGFLENLKVTKNTTNSISVKWSKVQGANGYQVRCFSDNEESVSKKVTTTTTTFRNLDPGETYTIMVLPYKKSAKGFYAYGWESAQKLFDCTTALSKPKKLNVSTLYDMPGYLPQAKGYIEAEWSAVRGADGYEYRLYHVATGKLLESKMVKKLRTVFKSVDNRIYEVKVRAYSKNGNKTVYSSWTCAYHSLGVSMGTYTCNASSTKITTSWSKVSGATGYDVYVSFGDSDHYHKLRTVKEPKTTVSWSKSKANMIFIKVIAVRKKGDKTYRFTPKNVQYIGR